MTEHTSTSGDPVRRTTDQDHGSDGRRSVTDPETSALTGRWERFAEHDTDEDRTDDSNAAVRTLKFVYRYSTALVPASVLWVVFSLPLVTVGPATLGLYTAVLSLHETGTVDRKRVVSTVRSNLAAATMLGFLPVAFVGIATLYVVSGLSNGFVGTALTAAALYAGLYVGVLLVPTFVAVASGVEPRTALREAYLWIAGSPTVGLHLLLVTGVVLVASLGLTIGFLLFFAGITGTYHVEVVCRAADEDTQQLPSLARTTH